MTGISPRCVDVGKRGFLNTLSDGLLIAVIRGGAHCRAMTVLLRRCFGMFLRLLPLRLRQAANGSILMPEVKGLNYSLTVLVVAFITAHDIWQEDAGLT